MKQLIVTVGLVLLGLAVFRMMVTDSHSLYRTAAEAITQTKEYYECKN